MKLAAVSRLTCAVLILAGCKPPRFAETPDAVSVSMRWGCYLPEHLEVSDFTKQNPAAKPVTLSFARYPNVVLVVAQPGLCDALGAANKPIIPVLIEPLRDSSKERWLGYRLLSVNGYSVGEPYGLQESAALDGHAPSLEELLR